MASNASFKRARQDSLSSQSSLHDLSVPSPPSPTGTPAPKALRLTNTSQAGQRPLLCTLPPTCHPPHNTPTALANPQDLEAHYAKCHAHVCAERACVAVFPTARLLELHQTECHDPLASVKKDRGEKIFACHLESCDKRFLDPKKRRLHLIQAHGYPKQYFFAVTNKGVGGLLKKWGEGASLIRGAWKARPENLTSTESMDVELVDEDDNQGSESETVAVSSENTNKEPLPSSSVQEKRYAADPLQPDTGTKDADGQHQEVTKLASTFSSLSLVPTNVRFGRGGKSVQMVRQGRPRKDSEDANAKSAPNPPTDQPADTSMLDDPDGIKDGNISINIDAALEALKQEAEAASPVRRTRQQIPGKEFLGARDGPRGRGRGNRGRGRGGESGRGRGGSPKQ